MSVRGKLPGAGRRPMVLLTLHAASSHNPVGKRSRLRRWMPACVAPHYRTLSHTPRLHPGTLCVSHASGPPPHRSTTCAGSWPRACWTTATGTGSWAPRQEGRRGTSKPSARKRLAPAHPPSRSIYPTFSVMCAVQVRPEPAIDPEAQRYAQHAAKRGTSHAVPDPVTVYALRKVSGCISQRADMYEQALAVQRDMDESLAQVV